MVQVIQTARQPDHHPAARPGAYPGRTAGPQLRTVLRIRLPDATPARGVGACWPSGWTRRPGCAANVRRARHGRRGPAGTVARRHPPDRRITGRTPGCRPPAGRFGVGRAEAAGRRHRRPGHGGHQDPGRHARRHANPAEATRAAGELLRRPATSRAPGAARGRRSRGRPQRAAAEAVLAATRLRAGLGLAWHLPPELTEAVAALQDVLLRVRAP